VVYLCREAVDFRKGINGLAALVEEVLELDPFSEQLFVFCNRARDRVRILYWEKQRFLPVAQAAGEAPLPLAAAGTGAVVTLTGQQLNWLLDGLDVMRMPRMSGCSTGQVS
jgi:transposase